jgi:MFS family permease
MMTIALILVLELSSKKKRGLFVGLVNAGFTTGVSFGAVLAGALLPVTGWVRVVTRKCEMQNANDFVRDSCSGFKPH